jgi:predicted TIM-barrel fold metal-dependent hydrolase
MNAWRMRTPGPANWNERLNPASPSKYFIVSCDNHANEPTEDLMRLWREQVDVEFHDRLPHYETDAEGVQWLHTDGAIEPQMVRYPEDRRDLLPTKEEYESFDVMMTYSRRMDEEDVRRASSGRTLEQRQKDRASQGVDAEIVFATKGLWSLTSPNPRYQTQLVRTYNRWLKDYYGADFRRTMPMALIAPSNVEEAVREVQWTADNGFHGIMLPNRPVFHRLDQPRHSLEYVDKIFDPLWSAIEETGLAITLHLGTGQDPRVVTGNGAAMIAYFGALMTTFEPMVQFIASGIFERHPKLKLVLVESGVGWLPWCLEQLDMVQHAHHMYMRPKLPQLPSDYFKQHCFSTFVEEPKGVEYCIDFGLEDNLLWAMDYPHHEGSFPHCAASIQRQLTGLTEIQRQKLLGLNAARAFNLDPHKLGR